MDGTASAPREASANTEFYLGKSCLCGHQPHSIPRVGLSTKLRVACQPVVSLPIDTLACSFIKVRRERLQFNVGDHTDNTSYSFQRVQLISPLEASVKLLPNVLTGFIVNLFTGLTVQYFSSCKLMAVASIIATVSPVIMAVINPAWSYWVAACWAVALAPVSIDGQSPLKDVVYQDSLADLLRIVLFTIAHIVITDVFPADMHALAGGVFNTVSQLGTSLGMSLVAVVSNAVVNASDEWDKESPEVLMAGYRAAFWTCAAMMLLSAGSSFGLRKLGKLGGGHTSSASR